jgi:hypothetical protein
MEKYAGKGGIEGGREGGRRETKMRDGNLSVTGRTREGAKEEGLLRGKKMIRTINKLSRQDLNLGVSHPARPILQVAPPLSRTTMLPSDVAILYIVTYRKSWDSKTVEHFLLS